MNSIRFDIHESVLNKDLIDLGLPKGNCGSITKIYGKNRLSLRQKMISTSMRINSFSNVSYSVDEILSTKSGNQLMLRPIKVANVNMEVNASLNKKDSWTVSLTKQQLDRMILDL
jgi:hypothetical protein